MLVPFVNPVWVQYVSHKLGRLLVPWALLGAFVSSAALAWQSWPFTAVLGAQFAFYALAAHGAWLDAKERGAWSWSGGSHESLSRSS